MGDFSVIVVTANERLGIASWDEFYRERQVESMPWFNPHMDGDLKEALDELGLQGGSLLDLGTGPGTQAIQLARRGFDVTATDISGVAVCLAEKKAKEQGLDIIWMQDDILVHSNINSVR